MDLDKLKKDGNECFNKKDFAKAADYYTHSINLEKEKLSLLLSNRALSNYHLGNYEQALKDAEESFANDPNKIKPHYIKVLTYEKQNDFKKALELIDWVEQNENFDCNKKQEFLQKKQEIQQFLKKLEEEENTKQMLEESEKLKIQGNNCFGNKEYKAAIDFYTKAIDKFQSVGTKPKEFAVYLTNRALSNYHLNKNVESLQDCNEAVKVNPHWAKAKYIQILVHKMEKEFEKALKILEDVEKDTLLENNNNIDFDELKNEINQQKNKKNHKNLREEEFEEFRNSNKANLEQMKLFEMMSQFLPNQTAMFSETFPFHKEYAEEYPNESEHCKALETHYHQVKAFPLTENMLEMYSIENPQTMLQRFTRIDPRFFDFLNRNAEPGTIIEFMNQTIKFGEIGEGEASCYHCLQNHPSTIYVFELGRTYVGIGCVDLTQLLFGEFKDLRIIHETPLRFIGIDISEVSISRCHILYKMIQMNLRTASILQVWYSSGWSKKTYEDFQLACSELLKQENLDKKAKDYAKFWMNQKIIHKKWQKMWKFNANSFDPLENLVFKRDRIDYSRYALTGELFEKDNEFGNVTFFTNLCEEKNVRICENIFFTYCYSHFVFEGSLLKTLENTLQSRLETVKKLILKGEIVCEFKIELITSKNKKELEKIKQLQPFGVFWSNIPDYFNNKEFLNIAKLCSSDETVHTCHFLNWTKKVWGTSIVDYPNNKKKYVYDNIIKLKKNSIKMLKTCNLIPNFVNSDIVEFPLNSIDRMLQSIYYKKFIEFYFDDKEVCIISDFNEVYNIFLKMTSFFEINFTFNRNMMIKLNEYK